MATGPDPKPTYAEYLEAQGPGTKSMWVGGEIFAMSGGSLVHNRLCSRLLLQIGGALPQGCEVVGSDQRLRVDEVDLACYPDLQVICGEWSVSDVDPHAVTNPVFVVEVLSPSTESWDRGRPELGRAPGKRWRRKGGTSVVDELDQRAAKREALQRLESLQAYLMVSQEKRRMELYVRDGSDWRYTSHISGPIRLPVGVTLDLDGVYEGLVA